MKKLADLETKRFDSKEETLNAAKEILLQLTKLTKKEYAGLIFKDKIDGKYIIPVAAEGSELFSDPLDVERPENSDAVMDYHTHPDKITFEKDGKRYSTYPEDFSDGDIANIERMAKTMNLRKGIEPWSGSLITPNGEVKNYTPDK